ncbi:glycerophosphodiester phosphodiesterase [Ramlibacter henchirensis]|uniref:Glycerophosphodiester phosphodiesterase n=1 Tax=Ramlibacter henchirensis TaxID=204072 RepID=A0A4Z0C2T6_9BURK|nr:glycerophosphodiester phosphodiesterase [Ramlibacter henchirensis]TFZ05853.1 glycerophosphodiester phosphodiesterase [Ramlibacter henchirensis]
MTTLRRLLAFSLAALAFSANAFDLQGHRGARGLLPENTLPAFERALRIGVTTLEMDVGITADGVVVVSHDPVLNPDLVRGPDGQWITTPLAIRELTHAQLQAYDVGRLRPGSAYANTFSRQQPVDGTRMPTLASVFELVKKLGAGHVRFDIETKMDLRNPANTPEPQPFVEALLKVVRAAGMEERVMVQSFDWRTLQAVQKAAPRIPTVYLTTQSERGSNLDSPVATAGFTLAEHRTIPAMVKAAGGHVWSPNFQALTAVELKQAHSLGLKVIPWTVNDPADIERLIALGVDGIISDYPDRVRTVMQRRGMPLPPAIK